jgi:integrase
MALKASELLKAKLPAGKALLKIYDREHRSDLSGIPGLFLLITKTGSKLWKLQYRFDGKPSEIALGAFTATTQPEAKASLDKARRDAIAKRELIARGISPSVKIDTTGAEQANSFKAVAIAWHKWWSAGDDVNDDTAAYIMRRLEADVFPVFGNRPIDSITAKDVRNLILDIEKRGARDVAQRQHGTISQIYRYAVVHELAENNPAAAFKPSDVLTKRKTKNRAHIEPSELPALLVAMDDYNRRVDLKLALKLMALTFVRTAELIEAPWSEFDLDNAIWKISPERMKKSRVHIVPLSRQAVAILKNLKWIAKDRPYVFPGQNVQTKDGTINCNSLLNALEELECKGVTTGHGYKGIMTGHGYRGLARTILAEKGFEKAHVELQLAHANDDKTEAAYNHAQYLPQRVKLMQWWADHLDDLLKQGKAAKVA